MQRIQLDLTRLFGFKIVASEKALQGGDIRLSAKIGDKVGDKAPPPVAAPLARTPTRKG